MNGVKVSTEELAQLAKLSGVQMLIWSHAFTRATDDQWSQMTNDEWATLLNVTPRCISRAHSRLSKLGAIETDILCGRIRLVRGIRPHNWTGNE